MDWIEAVWDIQQDRGLKYAESITLGIYGHQTTGKERGLGLHHCHSCFVVLLCDIVAG